MVITMAWKRQREGSLAAGPGSDHHTTIDEYPQPLEDRVVIKAARRRDLPAGRRVAGLLAGTDFSCPGRRG